MRKVFVGLALIFCAESSWAQAVKSTYKYDSQGRLKEISTPSGPASGKTVISYDLAGNRLNFSVSGSKDGSDRQAEAIFPNSKLFVVVPLNGFTLIPIQR